MSTQPPARAAGKGSRRSETQPRTGGDGAGPAMTEHRNEVAISGRLSAAAQGMELPSGDQIVTWRLVVDRVAADGARRFDVVDCTTFGARLRRQALGWHEDEVIEVTGALRRRFWRGPAGVQSRCEVIAESARRVGAAPRSTVPPTRAKRPRTPG